MPNFGYIGPATTHEEAIERLWDHHGLIAIDTETVSLTDRRCIGIGLAISPTEAYYFPAGHDFPNHPNVPESANWFDMLERIGRDEPKTFFNAPFDLDRLEEKLGFDIEGKLYDVANAMHVQGLPNALDVCMGEFFCETHQTISDILPSRKTMLDVDYDKTANKCIHDCLATYRLHELIKLEEWGKGRVITWLDYIQRPYVVEVNTQECYEVDTKLVPLLRRMAKRGVKLDQPRVKYWYERLSEEMYQYQTICEQEGFNPGSNQQVGYVLASRGNFLPFTKSGKQLQVNEEALESVGDPLGFIVLEYRKRQKLRSTYAEPWVNQLRAYTHYRIDLATGRLASFDRNFQNIPAAPYNMRDVFLADSGVWTWADFSQIEMRVFANITQDPVMMQAYKDYDAHIGESIHSITQNALWPGTPKSDIIIYTRAKTFNFAMIYDANEFTLSRQTKRPIELCKTERAAWLSLYPNAKPTMDRMMTENYFKGYAPTLFGRKCRLPDAGMGYTEDHIMKCGINYPIQGTAADIIKRGMLMLDDWGVDFPIQVHDEVVCDGDYPDDLFIPLSTIHPEILTPMEVKHGATWS